MAPVEICASGGRWAGGFWEIESKNSQTLCLVMLFLCMRKQILSLCYKKTMDFWLYIFLNASVNLTNMGLNILDI